ncbi:MAG: ACP S-malonyltransferase [Fibromonadaceae bacterium]|jgi:[acyl-carrier-protein] S-malonyltransferase|nr:ACP S-malonyltransferase [Fibromonadaceae bacterium]
MAKTILLFPGQGAQYVGMGKALSETFEPARQLLKKADEVLGFELSKIMQEGPEELLKSTDNTQPALYVCSCMAMELLKSKEVDYDYVAGHSLGEYSAIYAAGGFSFEDGLRLVRVRGELMAKAGELKPGAMAAVLGLSEEDLSTVLAEAASAGVVVAANFNSPGQIVISGSKEGVAKASELANAKGAKKVVPLPVSGAFHSPLMEYALPGLKEAVEKTSFSDLQVPVIANVTSQAVSKGSDLQELLVKQLVSPVRWQQGMEAAISLGVDKGIEVGAGKVLMGLMRQINRDIKVNPVETEEQLNSSLLTS